MASKNKRRKSKKKMAIGIVMTMLDRTCKTCGVHFQGGPRAMYCPACRTERRKESNRKRRENGTRRPLGSTDLCEICGNVYIVASGLQKYCQNCAEKLRIEHDRLRALEYYEKNKAKINLKRSERRKIKSKTCVICGKAFDPGGKRRVTCSGECRDKLVKIWQRRADQKRSPRNKTMNRT